VEPREIVPHFVRQLGKYASQIRDTALEDVTLLWRQPTCLEV
jgi:hypothetical protein